MAATFIYLAIYLMLKWGMSKAYAIHPYVEKQNKMVGAYCNTPSSQTNTFAFSPNWLNIILISISYLLALLCKETAVGLLPVVLMFLFLKTDKLESNFLKRRLLLFIPFVITTSFYMLLRSYVINKDVGLRVFTGIQSQPELTSNDLTSSNISIIEAIGFYIKKLFLPLPLNFIIVDINRSLYFWLGLMIIAVVLYILYKRNLYSFIVMLMISFIAPALMILMRNMTWTFVSERYLYISSFGAVLLIVVLFYRITASMSENLRLSLLFCLIIASCFITVNRVYIWQSNVTLFEDVIKKSPNSGYAANEYGIALAQNKQYLEALNQFKIARSLSRKSYKIPIFNQISTELQETGDLQKAKNSYIDQLKDPQTYRYPLLLKIVEITDQQLLHIKNDQKVRDIIIEQIFYLNQAAKLKKTGYTYYKLGQLYLNISDNINARENFEKSIELEPNGYCAASAKKLIKSLQ
jgi:tetratricopeptide (TPR) repeat protein